MKKADGSMVFSIRVPTEMVALIEEFVEETNMERPSHALRVLVETGLERYSEGRIDVDRLAAVQSNATAEALAVMYDVLAEVVERVIRR